jgi:acetyl esterase/lipase
VGLAVPPERSGYPAPSDLAERRKGMDAALAAGTWKTKRPPVETVLGGRRTLRFGPEAEAKGTVLHFHGGGFRIGGPEMEGPFAEALADRCGVEVVVPQYRLAPEHPFPCGLVDALSALTALREDIGDTPLVVSGDSAGGGLAAALAVRGGVRIDGLVLLSPWLDTTVTAPAFTENAATDHMFSKESADIAAGLYLQGQDPAHPLASPLLASIEAFPPTLISVGLEEVLRDDSLRFHDKLRALGVRSELIALAGMEHVAVVRDLEMPGAHETFDAIAGFIDRIVAERLHSG